MIKDSLHKNFLFDKVEEKKKPSPDWWREESYLNNFIKRSRLTLIKKIGKGKGLYQCECGKKTIAKFWDVRTLHKMSCGCARKTDNALKKVYHKEAKQRYEGKDVPVRCEGRQRAAKARWLKTSAQPQYSQG